MRFALALLVAFATPAAASGALDAGPVVVAFENGHHSDCVESASGLCVATATGGDLGDQEIDADQRLDWIHLVANVSWVEERVGVELLPDAALVIDFREIYVRHPVFLVMTETLDGKRVPGPAPVGFFGDAGGFGVWYPKANRSDPTTPQYEPYGIGYGDDAWLTYRAIGPIGTFDIRSTDQQWSGLANITCLVTNGSACAPARAWEEAMIASTPNVHAAFSLHEAWLGTNESLFGKAGGLARAVSGRSGGSGATLAASLLRVETASAGEGALPFTGSPLGGSGSGAPPPLLEVPPGGPRPSPEDSVPPVRPSVAVALVAAAVLAVAAGALYSRIRSAREALNSPRRARLHAIVRERGACTMRELCEALDLGWSPVEHHVRILQQHGLVVVERQDGAVLIRAPGPKDAPVVALRGHAARALLAIVQARPDGIPRDELHALAGDIPRRSRNHALSRLLELGWIQERQGRLVARSADG